MRRNKNETKKKEVDNRKMKSNGARVKGGMVEKNDKGNFSIRKNITERGA